MKRFDGIGNWDTVTRVSVRVGDNECDDDEIDDQIMMTRKGPQPPVVEIDWLYVHPLQRSPKIGVIIIVIV